MFSASSIEEFARRYRDDQRIVNRGMWSVLLAADPELSAEFGNRYFDIFNDISEETWHLALFSNFNNNRKRWEPSEELHDNVNAIIRTLGDNGRRIGDLSIAFIDPYSMNNFSKCVVVLLDSSRIADFHLYKSGLIETHRCILSSYKKLGINRFSPVTSSQYALLTDELHRNITRGKILSFVTSPVNALLNAALGVVMGMPF